MNLSTQQREEICSFLVRCFNESDGGFSSSPGQDSHIVSTLNAVQSFLLIGKEVPSVPSIEKYAAGLIQSDGSVAGDCWGEVDTRFSFCALLLFDVLKVKSARSADVERYILKRCQNFDSGFGSGPGGESHAGQVFCCVGALSIEHDLTTGQMLHRDRLSWWLAMRQLGNGGLNGRPEKLEDVCYSWWTAASLAMLGRLDWIDVDALVSFILGCQDLESGGFSDRPGNAPDVFHTCFALAGLSLAGYDGLACVDPIRCLPKNILHEFGSECLATHQ